MYKGEQVTCRIAKGILQGKMNKTSSGVSWDLQVLCVQCMESCMYIRTGCAKGLVFLQQKGVPRLRCALTLGVRCGMYSLRSSLQWQKQITKEKNRNKTTNR